MVRCSCFMRAWRSSLDITRVVSRRLPCGRSGWGCPLVLRQLSQTSKSVHVSHRHPVPGSISWLHRLQVATYAGSVGLCRWNRTIMLLCFARRSVSNWYLLPWHMDRKAWRVSKNSHSMSGSASFVSGSAATCALCSGPPRHMRSSCGRASSTAKHSSHSSKWSPAPVLLKNRGWSEMVLRQREHSCQRCTMMKSFFIDLMFSASLPMTNASSASTLPSAGLASPARPLALPLRSRLLPAAAAAAAAAAATAGSARRLASSLNRPMYSSTAPGQ